LEFGDGSEDQISKETISILIGPRRQLIWSIGSQVALFLPVDLSQLILDLSGFSPHAAPSFAPSLIASSGRDAERHNGNV
jgi:hypothetical protein